MSGQCPPEGGPALEQSGNMFYHLGEESGTNYANSGAVIGAPEQTVCFC